MHELGNTLSDQDVNAVASQHFDAQQVADETVHIDSSSLCIEYVFHLKFQIYRRQSVVIYECVTFKFLSP